jgi:hypothetical protein
MLRNRISKAGLSGLCLLWALLIQVAMLRAEPLILAVASAQQAFDQYTSQPVIAIRLTAESAAAFGKFTTENVGRKIELRADGRVLMSPVIRDPILGGTLQVSGSFTVAEAKEIARKLSAPNARIEAEAVAD